MNVEDWKAWKAAPDGSKEKRRLFSKLARDNIGIVKLYVGKILRTSRIHCDPEDALQAGWLGFTLAAERWDPTRAKFSTMSWFWIRAEVQKCLLKETPIYRPPYAGMPYSVHRKTEAFEARNGRNPTAADLGIEDKDLAKWRSYVFRYTPLDEIQQDRDDNTAEYQRHEIHFDVTAQIPSAEDVLTKQEDLGRLCRAFTSLSEQDRKSLAAGRDRGIYREALDRLTEAYYLLEDEGQ